MLLGQQNNGGSNCCCCPDDCCLSEYTHPFIISQPCFPGLWQRQNLAIWIPFLCLLDVMHTIFSFNSSEIEWSCTVLILLLLYLLLRASMVPAVGFCVSSSRRQPIDQTCIVILWLVSKRIQRAIILPQNATTAVCTKFTTLLSYCFRRALHEDKGIS